MAYGWEGKLVKLVPLDVEQHFEHAIKWMNDPDITQYLLAGDFPMTRLAEREWFDAHSKTSREDVQFGIETLQGKHVGFSGIHAISWRNGTATTGTVLDHSEWSKGYGTDAANVRSHYAFEVLGLRMLYSSVLDGNERSLKMLARAGYQECGRMPRRHWKRGGYVDEILLYLEREAWTRRSPQ